MRFYLGTHEPYWLGRAAIPWFVALPRLVRLPRPPPRALRGWALDSGAFSEIAKHGRWTLGALDYADHIGHYAEKIGNLEFASPQDWMCEPDMVARTGLSVREHQRRTVENFQTLRALSTAAPVIPVLQGWTIVDYERHVAEYEAAGVELALEPLVGLGSVCRRQATEEIRAIVTMLAGRYGLRCHGYGVKAGGLAAYAPLLASADSMAWSYQARRNPPLPGCTHRRCNNCLRYALLWRERQIARILAA